MFIDVIEAGPDRQRPEQRIDKANGSSGHKWPPFLYRMKSMPIPAFGEQIRQFLPRLQRAFGAARA
jgi:hypothetical protein